MAVSITLNKQSGREWFTSLEDICGTVVLVNKNCIAVSAITIVLQCTQKTWLRPTDPTKDFGSSKCILFARRASLFRLESNRTQKQREKLAPGVHQYPFSMEVPLTTSDNTTALSKSNRNELALPPSFQLSVHNMKVSVRYELRVVVERPGLLHKDLAAVREIVFRPLEPPDLPESLAAPSSLQRVMVHFEAFKLSTEPFMVGEAPPPYRPAVGFEIGVPGCGLAHSGDHIALEISLDVPKAFQLSAGTLWLTQLIIRIRAATTATADCTERTHLSYVNVCNVKGVTPLEFSADRERSYVSSDLWVHHVYPHMLPSFVSGGVRRTHRLEVLASIMAQSTQEIHTVAAGIDVVVKSGPLATYE